MPEGLGVADKLSGGTSKRSRSAKPLLRIGTLRVKKIRARSAPRKAVISSTGLSKGTGTSVSTNPDSFSEET